MHVEKFLTPNQVSGLTLGKRSVDSVRRDVDAGVLKAIHVGRDRAIEITDGVLYGLKYAAGLSLTGFSRADAETVAKAIRQMDRRQLVAAYPLVDLFCTLSDSAGRSVVAAALMKFTVPALAR